MSLNICDVQSTLSSVYIFMAHHLPFLLIWWPVVCLTRNRCKGCLATSEKLHCFMLLSPSPYKYVTMSHLAHFNLNAVVLGVAWMICCDVGGSVQVLTVTSPAWWLSNTLSLFQFTALTSGICLDTNSGILKVNFAQALLMYSQKAPCFLFFHQFIPLKILNSSSPTSYDAFYYIIFLYF